MAMMNQPSLVIDPLWETLSSLGLPDELLSTPDKEGAQSRERAAVEERKVKTLKSKKAKEQQLKQEVVACAFDVGICTALCPSDLRPAAAVNSAWLRSTRSASAAAIAGAVGKGPGSSTFANELEVGSIELCGLVAGTPCFDFQDFRLGLIVVADCKEAVLPRAFELLSLQLPTRLLNYIRLPCPAAVTALRGEGARWRRAGPKAEGATSAVQPTPSDLRRIWSTAYVDSEGGYDELARQLTFKLVERWRGLWYCSRFVDSATTSCLHCMLKQPSEVRGSESWMLDAVAISLPSSVVSVVTFRYYDDDKHFVR